MSQRSNREARWGETRRQRGPDHELRAGRSQEDTGPEGLEEAAAEATEEGPVPGALPTAVTEHRGASAGPTQSSEGAPVGEGQ